MNSSNSDIAAFHYSCSDRQHFGLAGIHPTEILGGLYATNMVLGGMLPIEVGDGEHLFLLCE